MKQPFLMTVLMLYFSALIHRWLNEGVASADLLLALGIGFGLLLVPVMIIFVYVIRGSTRLTSLQQGGGKWAEAAAWYQLALAIVFVGMSGTFIWNANSNGKVYRIERWAVTYNGSRAASLLDIPVRRRNRQWTSTLILVLEKRSYRVTYPYYQDQGALRTANVGDEVEVRLQQSGLGFLRLEGVNDVYRTR